MFILIHYFENHYNLCLMFILIHFMVVKIFNSMSKKVYRFLTTFFVRGMQKMTQKKLDLKIV
jgi:hypothetical protein